ncbi:hypothetical protein Salmi_Mp061 (mitochondrion) [Salvia miltiorrhiza]|uniref:Uncharacterized protein n=1 Tax=Salvia miltiorrhiza TaxID=226208 RepID=V9P4R9_SALMI|nr:hypothetical protein Salmi_Mp061 [Salvia miltiorrhiza]AGU16590.1 hypothetical protein Salmi_Mp061 [Salvia miltiorrhiza]
MKAEMEVQARVGIPNQCSQVRTNTQDKDKLQPACIEFSRILNQPEALENEVEKKCLERACPLPIGNAFARFLSSGSRPVSVHKNARFIPLVRFDYMKSCLVDRIVSRPLDRRSFILPVNHQRIE